MNSATVKKDVVYSISFAHMLNDWYMNIIPILTPFLIAAGFGIGEVSFAISAFTITSSLSQPLIGYMVDRKNQSWMIYVGTAWLAILLSCIGLTHSSTMLLALAALSGLGAAAFHPQASAMVSAASGQKKGMYQAVFGASGNLGWALTPLFVIPLVERFGLSVTPYFVVPGIIVTVLLAFKAQKTPARSQAETVSMMEALRPAWKELSKLVLIIAVRTLTYSGLVAFLPLYLQQQGMSLSVCSHLLFILLLSGAAGGIAGGYLSDRFGKTIVIFLSLALSPIFFYLFLHVGAGLQPVVFALAGATLLSSFSPIVVLAQELLFRQAAMASGFSLGFGIGIGGLGVGLVGLVIQYAGLALAINMLICLPFVAACIALTLKGRKTLEQAGFAQ